MNVVQELADLPSCRGEFDLVARVCDDAAAKRKPLVEALVEAGLADETPLLRDLGRLLGMEWWESEMPPIPAPLRERFPVRLAVKHRLYPVEIEGQPLRLLTADPFDIPARQRISLELGVPIRWVLCDQERIKEGLRQGYGVGAEIFEALLDGREEGEASLDLRQETTILDAEDSEASVVRFVNQILREALRERATDIHIEPLEDDLSIRHRIDGVLHEIPVPPRIKMLQDSVISRVKIMARLDIAERRLPQDGRINLELEGRAIDVRVATIPSVLGESVSLRLLGREKFDFDRLRLDEAFRNTVHALLAEPNGIVLLTGPTGCGKSTTLYTFLSSLNTRARRIVTIEDPVEYKLPGVVQIPVRPEIGLTFATGLRSILRGDPNVIMVGEMRDFETAEIAIRAALTGHLVFSTLHTNDAVGGITRLIDMGVEPYLVASSVRAFIAQRLVRVLCPKCSRPEPVPEERLREIGFPVELASSIREAAGCDACRRTGYQGRMAILEICRVTPKLHDMIVRRESANALRAAAAEEGMRSLRLHGWARVAEGYTTIAEVLRVTTADAELLDE